MFATCVPTIVRHEDIPWLPKLSPIISSINAGQTDGEGKKVYFERFETLGVSEGDSSHVKKVREGENRIRCRGILKGRASPSRALFTGQNFVVVKSKLRASC